MLTGLNVPRMSTEGSSRQTVQLSRNTSIHLDFIRGAAAFVVLLNHVRALLFVDFSAEIHRTLLTKAIYEIAGYGHSAVIIFFVLSGYFISASAFRATSDGRWSLGWYAEQRLTRLYTVLVPALMLGALLDFVGMHIFDGRNVYDGLSEYHFILLNPVKHSLNVRTWLGNLAFLQGIACPVFGSNGPLWSLSYEFWYYVLFALGLVVSIKRTHGAARIGCLMTAVVVLWLVGRTIDLYFFIWLLGVVAGKIRLGQENFLSRNKYMRLMAWTIGWLAFALCLMISRHRFYTDQFLIDLPLAISFSLILLMMLNFVRDQPNRLYEKVARFTSGISYTLYLVHVPFLVFLCAWLIGTGRRWQMDGIHIIFGIGLTALAVLYANVVWRLTESHTNQVRKFVDRMHLKPRAKLSTPS